MTWGGTALCVRPKQSLYFPNDPHTYLFLNSVPLYPSWYYKVCIVFGMSLHRLTTLFPTHFIE